MRRVLGLAVLLTLLPGIGDAQSINYYPAAGGSVTTVATNSTAVATSGTSAEVLHSMTLPAGSLSSVGDYVDVNVTWVGAANANGKGMAIRLTGTAGTVLVTLSSSSSAVSFIQQVRFTRTGATTALSVGENTNTAVTAWATSTVAHTGLDFTAPIVFAVVGTTATQAGDVTATSSKLTVTTR